MERFALLRFPTLGDPRSLQERARTKEKESFQARLVVSGSSSDLCARAEQSFGSICGESGYAFALGPGREPLTVVGQTESLKNAHGQTLTLFRMPFLQFCRLGSSGGQNSLMAESLRLQRRSGRRTSGLWNIAQRLSSHAHYCGRVAVHNSSTFSKGLQIVFSSRQGPLSPVVRSVVNASDDSEATSHFFYDELIEAKSIVQQKVEGSVISVDPFHPGPTVEEGTSQRKEGTENEKPPETNRESGTSKVDVRENLETSRPGRMPIESNGPPMVILQPYLVSDNSQEQVKEKLRQLPLPMPHKVRPTGLPRPSLRRRLGVGYSRKSIRGGEEGKFVSRDPAVDI